MAVVIAHKEMGIYLGNFWGLGFWTKLDLAGQESATTFESESAARKHISTWDDCSNEPYTFIDVPDEPPFIELTALIRMGHRDHFSDDSLAHLLGNVMVMEGSA